MIKNFLKYCLSFCLILTGIVTVIGKNSAQENQSNNPTFTVQQESKEQNDFTKVFFTSNSEHDNKSSNHILFENELDDYEIKSFKNNLNNRVSCLNILSYFKTAHYLSRVKNILPIYSHQANTSKCWYILYRVFRI